MPTVARMCFAPNAPKSHLGVSHDQNVQTLHIWEVKNGPIRNLKCQSLQKEIFAPNAPKRHLGVYPMTKICIFGGSNCLPHMHAATNTAAISGFLCFASRPCIQRRQFLFS